MTAPVLPEIAFDEAGNTGADLLNPEQPVFALASVSLGRSESDELLSSVRIKSNPEVKFARLKRSESGRRRILAAMASPLLSPATAALSACHKRFMAIAKVVDLLVEPLAHSDGHNLYRGGANLSLANILYISLPVYFGEEQTVEFLRSFVTMFRARSPESVVSFYSVTRRLFELAPTEGIARLLAPLLASDRIIGEAIAANAKLSLDPAIPAFFRQCAHWGEQLGQAFRVVHDQSKPIFQDRETLESFMDPSAEPVRIGSGDRSILFPLSAERIEFGNSEDDPRLQVADLLASAAATWINGRIEATRRTSFTEALGDTQVPELLVTGIWPTPDVMPQELVVGADDSADVIDDMHRFLRRKRE